MRRLVSLAHYLVDAEATLKGIKLTFFESSTGALKEVLDKDYQPYFLVPHPLSEADKSAIENLKAETKIVTKIDFFTGQTVKVTQVVIRDPSDLRRASEKFEKVWEDEVPHVLGYAYDKGLVFGAQHSIQGDEVRPILEVSKEAETKFEERFSDLKKGDPTKYALLERWLVLCSQPVPEINPKTLGARGSIDPQDYYLAFMLSRVANLPVPQALFNQQVSSWIRSILYSHLRRNSILIPTSKELRSGEPMREVQGALTFQPEAGVYFNTVVTDFESLYPSLIDAYNLSYETVNCAHAECQSNKVPGLGHHVCLRRRGVYSVLIGSLRDLRIRWFKPLARDKSVSDEEKKLAYATSQLLKLILVSSYGVTVRIHGLARPSLAESITAYGRYSLQTTWDMAKEDGLHPIYGDTDSLFLDNPREGQVDRLIKEVKERLHLDLAVAERYSLCVLPRAMKAYFGIKTDGTADVKGVTAMKSNSPTFIENVFRNCVKELADVKNQTEYVAAKERVQKVVGDAITAIKAGKVPLKDLEYVMELHEDPSDKAGEKALHQPYQCALQLVDSGKMVQSGDIVKFVKVKPFQYRGRAFSVKPAELVKDPREVNVDDYIRNLRTALNQTFKPMNIEFKEDADRKVALTDFI